PGNTGEKGVWLSDGYIYFAILKYGEPGAPKLGLGQTSDIRGIHHIGFYVDDEQATAKSLEAANFKPVPIPKTERPETTPMGDAVNLKYLGPDDVQIDIRSRGWNEAISLGEERERHVRRRRLGAPLSRQGTAIMHGLEGLERHQHEERHGDQNHR